jgi:hypothetical protein
MAKLPPRSPHREKVSQINKIIGALGGIPEAALIYGLLYSANGESMRAVQEGDSKPMSEKDAVREKFIDVLASRLILEREAHDERDYKSFEDYSIQLAGLRSACARARGRAKAILTQSEYDAAVATAFRYANP